MSQKLENLLTKPFGDETDPAGFWRLLLTHIENMQVRNYASDTMRLRAAYVRYFALWCLDRDLDQPAFITKPILESYQRYLFRYRKENGKPLSWGSQHMRLQHVNQFFRFLVKTNHLPFNPASEIELPKQPKSLPKAILSEDEVERILAEPDTTTALGLRDRAIFEILYSSGIRRFEVCNLRIDQIDVERRTIFIQSGKGQKDRYVPVENSGVCCGSPATSKTDVTNCYSAGRKPRCFSQRMATRFNRTHLTEYARRYIKSSGVNKEGACHIFRHTMATLMLDNGADIRHIQAILGHARLETTQIYTRTSLRKLLEVHSKTHPAEKPETDDNSEAT